ncbi:MAG: nicotinate mononucleotide-dependent phosphoribosyltransferase CobT [Halobacteriota archaeon]
MRDSWVVNLSNQSGKSPNVVERYAHIRNPLFIVILSNTKIATIPGLSGAGSTPELIQYTPAADAEIISRGKLETISVMSDAPSGAITPAVLTRAGLELSQSELLLINAGLEITPGVPYYDLRAESGKDARYERAVKNPSAIMEASNKLAKRLDCDLAIIAETLPGGTTTAMCVLRALGYSHNVSSSFSQNPTALKQQIVQEMMSAAPMDGSSLKDDPLMAIELFGDPMMPCALGLVRGFSSSGTEIMLAGGTQMAAVIAALRALDNSTDVVLSTTKYVFDDSSAHLFKLVKALGVDAFSAYPDFSKSRVQALRKYEVGEVKEGVGAGGAMTLACVHGYDQDDFRRRVEAVITRL